MSCAAPLRLGEERRQVGRRQAVAGDHRELRRQEPPPQRAWTDGRGRGRSVGGVGGVDFRSAKGTNENGCSGSTGVFFWWGAIGLMKRTARCEQGTGCILCFFSDWALWKERSGKRQEVWFQELCTKTPTVIPPEMQLDGLRKR